MAHGCKELLGRSMVEAVACLGTPERILASPASVKRESAASTVVKDSAAWVARHASHVSVDLIGIDKMVDLLGSDIPTDLWNYEDIHYFDNGHLTIQYLFVVDTLNFCFWPDEDLQYDHLAAGLRSALIADASVLNAERLETITGVELRELLCWPRELPLEDERARLLQEVGCELNRSFGGQAANIVLSANGSAIALVNIIASHFPGFRDHCVYKGHQVFLYKRAQIFVGDVWGAFKGKGLGDFKDIQKITMFADYVVPAILRHLGVITYSSSLATKVDSQVELLPGSEEEVEIRACTIVAVEAIRERIRVKLGMEMYSVQLDWWLWSTGVTIQSQLHYHRTRTIYY